MIVKGDDTVRDVGGISKEQEKSIMDFLQGAVYCWCKNNKGEYFSLLELMGGDNRDWSGTPLEILCNKHTKNGEFTKEGFDNAGRDCGWLLKKVIYSDEKRQFETKETPINRAYRWLEN
jgi:hypothetical protein